MVADAELTCPGCGTAAKPLFRVGDRNRRLSSEEFTYRRCPRCGFVFLRPIPADLARYYPSDYYDRINTVADLARESAWERYKVEIVQRFVPSGRLLEIGSGRGGFVYQAKEAGFDVTAIEMDADSCAFIERDLGVRAAHTDDPAATLSADASEYDAIALWQVIEHLADPWRVLDAAAARVRPGGALVVAAPDPGSLQFRLLGRRWLHLDAPRHLQLIPRESLIARARAAGLEPALVTTRDVGGLVLNSIGWQFSLTNLVRSPRAKWLAMWLGRALSLAARPIERGADRGAAYTIVFRRNA